MIEEKLYLLATGFAGAVVGLLGAKYVLGVERVETVAWLGFVVTLGAAILLRMRRASVR